MESEGLFEVDSAILRRQGDTGPNPQPRLTITKLHQSCGEKHNREASQYDERPEERYAPNVSNLHPNSVANSSVSSVHLRTLDHRIWSTVVPNNAFVTMYTAPSSDKHAFSQGLAPRKEQDGQLPKGSTHHQQPQQHHGIIPHSAISETERFRVRLRC